MFKNTLRIITKRKATKINKNKTIQSYKNKIKKLDKKLQAVQKYINNEWWEKDTGRR